MSIAQEWRDMSGHELFTTVLPQLLQPGGKACRPDTAHSHRKLHVLGPWIVACRTGSVFAGLSASGPLVAQRRRPGAHHLPALSPHLKGLGCCKEPGIGSNSETLFFDSPSALNLLRGHLATRLRKRRFPRKILVGSKVSWSVPLLLLPPAQTAVEDQVRHRESQSKREGCHDETDLF